MKHQEAITTTATILSIESPTPTVRKLILEPSMHLNFTPGQFVLMSVLSEEGGTVERSYSIGNAPQKNGHMEFLIRLVEKGQMSNLIPQFQEGQELLIKGPYGRFGQLGSDAKSGIICIAGGVGISPVRSIIQSQIQKKDHPPLSLFWGFRKPEDYIYQQEFENYKSQGHLQRLEVSISDPSSVWSGHKGYCHELIQNRLQVVDSKAIFICGPPPMVDETKKVLLEMGFDRKQIHLEAW
jgi:anthranilate 1,2-dioxygenase reductase component